MDLRINRFLAPFLLSSLLLSILTSVISADSTVLSIDPPTYTVLYGETFKVNVTITEVTNLTGWEFKLFYLNQIVNCIKATEGPFLKQAGGTFKIFDITNDYNATHGRILAGCTLLGSTSVSGNGTLAIVTFQAFDEGDTILGLTETKLSDEKDPPQPIPHTTVDGAVHVDRLQDVVRVYPSDSYASFGEVFEVNITIVEVTNLTGWEFKLFYLNTVAGCTNITEGSFLEQGGSTFHVFNVTNDYNATHGRILAGCVILGRVSVSGSGTLASVSFQAFSRGETPLALADTKLTDEQLDPQPIPHTTIDGTIHVTVGMCDIAAINVSPSAFCVYKHHVLNVSALVANNGETAETFNVTLYTSEINGWHLVDIDERLVWYSDGQDAEKGLGENFWETTIITEVTVPSSNPALAFDTRYEFENLYDYGFVQVSTDDGETWVSLENQYTTFNHMPLAEPEIVAHLPGLTGTSEGWPDWMTMTFNLSGYEGLTVLLGFRYMTDTAILKQGWFVDNVTINSFEISNHALQQLDPPLLRPVHTLTVTNLTSGSQAIVIFPWNTTTTNSGTYSISCMAQTLEGESDTLNNFLMDGRVEVKMNPDLDGDSDVDIYDVVILAGAYGSVEGGPKWNPRADLIENGIIDIYDVVALVGYYGETLDTGCT